MASPKCAVIVLNYNGLDLLRDNFPSIVQAVEFAGEDFELIVLDNQSTDGSVEYLSSAHPNVSVEIAPANRVVFSYNWLVASLQHPYVLFLNNDIRLPEDGLVLLLEHFIDPDVAAVSGLLMNYDGATVQYGRATARFVRGFLLRGIVDAEGPGPTFYAGGGCAVFDREKYLALGGFDELYWPYYVEDLDLSYNAWKCGYRVLLEPRAMMFHMGSATIRPTPRTRAVIWQNNHLFNWKNISDPTLVLQLIIWSVVMFPVRATMFRGCFLRGVYGALRRIPLVLQRRKAMKALWKLSDREVMRRINASCDGDTR